MSSNLTIAVFKELHLYDFLVCIYTELGVDNFLAYGVIQFFMGHVILHRQYKFSCELFLWVAMQVVGYK
jgi:hypothetical protein